MRFIILKSNFIEALATVEKSVGLGSNLPILKNVLLRANGAEITAISTNLEIAVTSSFSGKVVEDGEIAVPFPILSSVVRNIDSERIVLEEKDKKISITTDNYNAVIQGFDSKEFPIIPKINKDANHISIKTDTLIDALENTSVATQYSEIRPEISGVLLKNSQDGSVCFVATDSFRLAEKSLRSSDFERFEGNSEDVRSIIPLRTIEDVLKILKSQKKSETVHIFTDQTQIIFKTDSFEMISRLIDGNFPEYKQIIPETTDTEVIVQKQELISAIKLTSSFAGRTNDILITSGDGNKFITLSSSDGSVGQNEYKIAAKIKGGGFSASFNWKYLLDGVKIFSSDENILLGINNSERPAKISSQTDASLVYVVMPIKK